MEGVGARLGRSSTRYGPATVFTGPVRKWKKKWVHVTPSNGASNHHSHSHTHNHHHNTNNSTNTNGATNGNNASHLLLYKWTPTSQSHSSNANNNNTLDKTSGKDDVPEEPPPRRKFKYIPIAVLEEQKDEAMENELEERVEDEAKVGAGETGPNETTLDEKPDINDVPMEESQDKIVRQDLNESTLDLSLNLNARDDEGESGSKADHK